MGGRPLYTVPNQSITYGTIFENLKEFLRNIFRFSQVSLDGFPFFFCAAVYCFEGAGMILSLEQSVPAHRRPHFKRYFVCTIGCITTLYIRLVNGYCAQSLLFELFSQNKLKLQLFLPFFQFRSQRIPVVRSRNERHHNFKSLIGEF